ncbi:CoA-transferase family III domain-containing protein [Mycena albidolilacea]|uniref:CoA-transferase family III domain-containing protein n=1 Tax=Mycena albidolilacea TaxID=1033008 RepID=A0AAD7F2Y9_9AGAR|nr:CoA-transferase family III domain-containing protein [Mycena albidolilacea]
MALSGLKVIEFAGLAPGPFAGLILADNGASVIRIDRPGAPSSDILCRGKKSAAINPKTSSGKAALLRLVASADVLIDPFRPGVMERLGLGPEVFLGTGNSPGLNDKLVYARMIGFPRTGPHKDMAGHDINYLALSGVLSILPGTEEKPSFPINLLGDFAGGGLTCAMGILLALVERGKSGRGQVVDTDMVSGSRYLSSFPLLRLVAQSNSMLGARGSRLLDGGAPFYNIYTCKDGRWMSVGCLEPAFFKAFIEGFVKAVPPGFTLDGWTPTPDVQFDLGEWPKLKEYLTKGFATQGRDYWAQIFHRTDACAVPILTPEEAAALDLSKSPFPAPHPRIVSQTQRSEKIESVGPESLALRPGQHTREILAELGLDDAQLEEMVREGAIGVSKVRESKL